MATESNHYVIVSLITVNKLFYGPSSYCTTFHIYNLVQNKSVTMSQDGYDVEVIGEVSSDFYCVICVEADAESCTYALWTWYV